MINLTLTDTKGNTTPVTVPTSWNEVTVLQFAQLDGKDSWEQIAVLIGLPIQEVRKLNIDHLAVFEEALKFTLEPMPEPTESQFPKNIGLESIGQLELAKKFITLMEEGTIWDMAPYIYAIYMWPDRYDIEAAFGLSGFPVELIKEAQKLSIVEVYAAIVFFSKSYSGFNQLLSMYLEGNTMQTRSRPMWNGLKNMGSSAA